MSRALVKNYQIWENIVKLLPIFIKKDQKKFSVIVFLEFPLFLSATI